MRQTYFSVTKHWEMHVYQEKVFYLFCLSGFYKS